MPSRTPSPERAPPAWAGVSAALHVLASSNALNNDDLANFYTQAQNARPYQAVSNYVLIDASRRQLLNTHKPWGSPLPALGATAAATHFRCRRTLVRISRQSSEGVLETVSLEGIPVITALSRSRLSDWCEAVGTVGGLAPGRDPRDATRP